MKGSESKGAYKPCTYCARVMHPGTPTHPTRDHIKPKSLGGIKTVWACWTCNQKKRNMTMLEWRRYMKKHPNWFNQPQKPPGSSRPCPVMGAIAQFFVELRYPSIYNPRPPVKRAAGQGAS